jgi:hypothetical protein
MLTLLVDGASSSLLLSSGSATYTFSSTTSGAHVVNASYSGDSTYAPSAGTVSLTVGSLPAGGFTFTASDVTISSGTSGTSVVNVTPNNGYTGTISFTVTSSPALTNGCFSIANATISGNTIASTTLTVNSSKSACASAAVRGASVRASGDRQHSAPGGPVGMGLSAMLFAGVLAYRPRKLRKFAGFCVLALAALTAVGCGGGGGTTTTVSSQKSPAGTYTLTITGTDTTTSSITSSSMLALTVN